jgi:hypothetical protein
LLKESRQQSDMSQACVEEGALMEAEFRLTVNGAEFLAFTYAERHSDLA